VGQFRQTPKRRKIKIKNFLKNNILLTIALTFLLFASSVLMMPLPVQAQTDTHGAPTTISYPIAPPQGVTPNQTIETIPYISVTPNPIGINQPLLVNLWMQPPLHVSRAFTQSFLVTFTKPDGTTETVGPMNSFQADGTAWFNYEPDQEGTWQVKFDFLGNFFPEGNYTTPPGGFVGSQIVYMASCYYKPSTSPTVEFTVQKDMVASWPPSALPTDYWSRPISPNNREWWIIAGHFPFTGVGGGEGWPANTNIYRSNYGFTPYVTTPNTAHVVWMREGEFGGLVGGQFGQDSFYMGGGFGRDSNIPIIVFSGKAYQTINKPMPQMVNGTIRTVTTSVLQCYDLATGKVNWEITDFVTPQAITKDPGTGEVLGAESAWRISYYLVAVSGSRLIKYNPYTGALVANVSLPVSSGTIWADPYVYSVQTTGTGADAKYFLINWDMTGTSTNFTSRILSNVSYPFSSVGTADFESQIAVSSQSISSNATGIAIGYRIMGASLETGALLWNTTTDLTTGQQTFFSGSTAVADHGKYAVRFNDGLWRCWDLKTGEKLWTTELSSYPWGSFGAYSVNSAYGYIYAMSYDGIQAIDWNTGKYAWKFSAQSVPFETPYSGNYSWFAQSLVADGKLFSYTNEHSPSQPLTRGYRLFCINATSGEGLWNITGYLQPGAVADGMLAAGNMYDGNLYVFGKSISATTISAPQTGVAQGQTVDLTGTVLDQAPAQPGTACVSAESMTQWMEYLHMQTQIPMNVIGVPVSLDTVDPNGNSIHIADVMTDMSGTYGYSWTAPDVSGQYQVTATFAGDQSYGSSWAQTYVSVDQASTTPQSTTNQISMPPYELYIVGTGIAVIVVILAALLLLRKRP
jgi:hypothetical protein